MQSSITSARFNGYLVGAGTLEDFEKDVEKLGWSTEVAEYVRKELTKNEGGSLYC